MADPAKAQSVCPSCDGPKARPHHTLCRACYLAERFPTPLRRWRRQSGRSFRELATESRVSYRTVMRAAAGKPIGRDSAAKLHRITRVPAATLIMGSV